MTFQRKAWHKIGWAGLLSLSLWGCQGNEIEDKRVKSSVGQGTSENSVASKITNDLKFKLTWLDQTNVVTAYHVFYNKDRSTNVGGEEIDSIASKDQDLTNPELMIDKTNMASFPAPGSTLCFYVIAENEGAMSPPSDVVCTKI